MEKKIQHVLTAPINLLRHATKEEREVFPDKTEGAFYTFGLASGQRYVAHIPVGMEPERCYTFRPLRNLLPHLKEIVWKGKKDIADLGYTTICRVCEGTPEKERKLYHKFLVPKPIPAPYLTLLTFKHYSYPPMLEKVSQIQYLTREHEKAKMALLEIQKQQNALLIPENKIHLIQRKLRERRQNG